MASLFSLEQYSAVMNTELSAPWNWMTEELVKMMHAIV
jgi:hypothetical protein